MNIRARVGAVQGKGEVDCGCRVRYSVGNDAEDVYGSTCENELKLAQPTGRQKWRQTSEVECHVEHISRFFGRRIVPIHHDQTPYARRYTNTSSPCAVQDVALIERPRAEVAR
jgi:hypothetical protein